MPIRSRREFGAYGEHKAWADGNNKFYAFPFKLLFSEFVWTDHGHYDRHQASAYAHHREQSRQTFNRPFLADFRPKCEDLPTQPNTNRCSAEDRGTWSSQQRY